MLMANLLRFLLCSLIMDNLCTSYNIAHLRRSLQSAPQNLQGMYQKTTDRILAQTAQGSSRSILAIRVLTWVAYSVRPLQVEELRHALAVEAGDRDLNHENLTSLKIFISSCMGLIKVDEQNNCRLVHLTAYDFFRTHASFDSTKAHLDFANTCLQYLSFKSFELDSCHDQASLEQ